MKSFCMHTIPHVSHMAVLWQLCSSTWVLITTVLKYKCTHHHWMQHWSVLLQRWCRSLLSLPQSPSYTVTWSALHCRWQSGSHLKHVDYYYNFMTKTNAPSEGIELSPGTLSQTWINFNLAWISNYIHYKVWDEITYPFPNFNRQPLKFGNG